MRHKAVLLCCFSTVTCYDGERHLASPHLTAKPHRYQIVGLFRSDVLYKTDIDVTNGEAVVPNWGWWGHSGNSTIGGMNDRMFYGLRRHAEVWATGRRERIPGFVRAHPELVGELHSERFML